MTTDVAKLTFDALTWNTTQTVMVTAAADADPEDETATLTHSASSETDNNYEGLSAEDLEVTVNDNAPDVRVSFLQDRYIVSEGASLTLTVEISADPERTIVVPIISINQAKASASDYSVLSTPVTFTAGGQLQQSFILTATDDRSVDAGESVKFMFGALPTKVSAGVSKETTVFITDNDVAGVTIDPIDLNVREGSENTYFVELDTQPTGNVVITINDPVDNSDVTVNPASLTFDGMNWNSPQPVTVTAGKDSDAEDDTATITHSVSSNRDIDYSMLLAQDVNVHVADNAAEVQVSFTQDSHIVAEGDDVFVAIVIDKDPGRLIRLPILLTYQNGASEFDLYQADGRLYFFRSGGSQEKGKFFYSGEDTVVDPGEFVQITFRDLPAKVSTGRFASTRVTIVDNDGTQSSQPHLSFLGVTTPSGGGISFDKYFHPEVTFYIASVPNSVTRIKVTASPFDDNATIEYLDGSNASLVVAATSDPDTVEIDLEEGKTIFKVKVTAEDATTFLIYTVSMNREASVDTTEPILQTAVADGNTITLTYSEALDANSIPAAAAFSVVVDGTAASLGSNPITVVGTVVTLTLMTAVTPGDTVTVSYAKPTGPTASPIRDEAGNLAADLSDQVVTNNTMTAPGALATFTAVAGSQQVVLSWTPPAQTGGSAITKYQYRVSADGVSWSPDWTDVPDGDSDSELFDERSLSVSSLNNGTTYTFQLRAVNAIGDGDPSETTATPAAAPNLPLSLDAVTGDDVVNIEEKAGGFNITGDTGSVDAASVVVVIGGSGNLTTTSDSNGTWSLSVPTNVMYISGGSVTITVNATKTGYTAAAQVTRNITIDLSAPTLDSAVADGNTITLTYSEALDANSIPAAAAFSVVVDGTAASLGSSPITVVGTVVTLTLMTAATPGDTVTVSYAKPTGPTASPIRDEAGNLAADLSDQVVTNNTMTAPGALATFTAVAGNQQVVLSWTPPAQTGGSAITKYQYRVSADGGSWSPDWTDVPDGTDSGTDLHDEASYTVGSLQNGTTYTFQLRAVNAIGDGDPSETTATPAAAPNLPLSLDAVTGDDVVNIEEKAGGFNITGDTGSVDAASVVVVIGGSGNLTTTSDSNGTWSLSVPTNVMYISGGSVTITVNATKTGYTAAAQVTRNITIDLSAPTLDSAVADGNTITLTYSEALDANSIPAAAAFSVVVDGTAASLGSSPITVVGTVVTLTLMTAATPGDTVTVSYAKPTGPTASPIRDEAGNLAADLSDQVVTNNTMTAPGALATFTAVAGNQQVVLSWTPPAQTGGSAITKYQYRVSADGVSWSPDWTDVPDGTDSGTDLHDEASYTVGSLQNGTTYTFQLRAVNAIGDGDPSETTATPVSPKTSDLLARDDEASTRHDIQVTIPVLTNDRSSNRDSLEVASVTQPTNGTVSRTSAAHLVKYTPKQGFAGTDNFTYTVSDGQETSTAKVQVTVKSSEIRGEENQKWVASPSTTRVAEGEITTIRFENTKENAAIPEGQLLIATLQIGRLEGTVDQADFQVEDNEGNVLQGREIKDPTIHHNGGWIYLVMWSSGSMANEFRIRTIPNEDSGSGDEYLVYWAYVHGLLVGSEVITIEPAQ